MLKFIYYTFGIMFLLYELQWLINPLEKAKDAITYLSLTKKYKGLKWKDYPEDFKEKTKSKVWGLIHIAFIIGGLFTFQWWVFLAFLTLQFTIVAFISRLLKPYIYAYAAFHWVNSIIGLAFCLFVIINAYHLKIELNEALSICGLNGWKSWSEK